MVAPLQATLAHAPLTISVAVAALAVFAVTAVFLLQATRPYSLTVAAGPRDGVDAKILQQIARRFAQENAKVRLELVFTDNANASYGLVAKGKADLAVTRADRLPEDALALMILRRSVMLLWSATKDKPTQLKDMKGTRAGVIGGSPDDIALVQRVLKDGGHPFEVGGVDTTRPPVGFALTAIVGPLRSKAVRDAISNIGQPQLVAIDTAEAIVQRNPLLESVEIPAGAVSVNPLLPVEALQTIGVTHVLVASKALSEEKASAFAKAVFADRNAILRESPEEAALEKPATEKDSAIPAHPGVAGYIDGTERTFLERYGDIFWGTVLVLSGLGSAGAWFRAFYHRDELDNTATMRDQLLELVEKLRDDTASADVVAMERKADALLRETLDRYERGALDDGALAAFGLALEHFRDVAHTTR
jgi:TRAP-type uncharacterized transport system substrate-binding protein